MIGAGALGASVSGNGPAFAAIARKERSCTSKKTVSKAAGSYNYSSCKLQKGERL